MYARLRLIMSGCSVNHSAMSLGIGILSVGKCSFLARDRQFDRNACDLRLIVSCGSSMGFPVWLLLITDWFVILTLPGFVAIFKHVPAWHFNRTVKLVSNDLLGFLSCPSLG